MARPDPTVYVRLPVIEDGGPLQRGDELLIWTCEPWTLVATGAVAVHPELTYVRAKTAPLDPPVVLAESLVERVLGPCDVKVLERFPGAAMDGVRFEPPFAYIPAREYGERGHTVLLADAVAAGAGTGLVPRCGLNDVDPVRDDGTYDERIGKYAGRSVEEVAADLIEDLRSRGKLLA